MAEIDVVKFYERAKNDFEYYCNEVLNVITDKESRVPFKLNSAQKYLLEMCQRQLKDKGYIRAVVLKPRRVGASTFIEARAFWKTHLNMYANACIISHSDNSASTIFNMAKVFYEFLPEELQHALKASNRKQLYYKDTHSKYDVYTATEKGISRSAGYTFLHSSETAWYENTASMDGVMQTIKEHKGTEIWFESTPNGMGGYFYEMYMNAKKHEIDYEPVFFKWYDFPEYSLKFRSETEKERLAESVLSHRDEGRYGDEESEQRAYNLSWEQLNWRRYTIDNKTRKSIDIFNQEYPPNDIDCFLQSGRPVFSRTICIMNQNRAVLPKKTGNIRWTDESRKSITFTNDEVGFIKVYSEPEAASYINRYACGVDVGEGGEDNDHTAAYVLDRLTRKIVLAWHGDIDDDKMADELHKIARYFFGDIYFCIERSRGGNTVIAGMKNHYKMYMTRHLDKRTQEVKKNKVGFETTSVSKPLVVHALRQAIREGSFECSDKEFWQECHTFVHADHNRMEAINKGKKNASSRYYDDRVMAMAFTLEMDRMMPKLKQVQRRVFKWQKELLERSVPKSYMVT